MSGPEVAAGLAGGGFTEYFGRLPYQKDAVLEFFQRENIKKSDFFLCARCCDLIYVLIFHYLQHFLVVATPTSPPKHLTSTTSEALPGPIMARSARFRYVFLCSLLLYSALSSLKHPANRYCIDGGGHNLADQ